VRVRVLAAVVSLPDLLMREGAHPEKPPPPFTPEWDLISVVDRLGKGLSAIETGQIVAALPISGITFHRLETAVQLLKKLG
jgi:NADPH:quinone reductase-like Zn-dependent oxidoreductase